MKLWIDLFFVFRSVSFRFTLNFLLFYCFTQCFDVDFFSVFLFCKFRFEVNFSSFRFVSFQTDTRCVCMVCLFDDHPESRIKTVEKNYTVCESTDDASMNFPKQIFFLLVVTCLYRSIYLCIFFSLSLVWTTTTINIGRQRTFFLSKNKKKICEKKKNSGYSIPVIFLCP